MLATYNSAEEKILAKAVSHIAGCKITLYLMRQKGFDYKMKIGMGNDHAGLEMKLQLKEFLEGQGHEVIDYGTHTPESCDYPVYGERVARAVAGKEVDQGILVCGTGVGISLAANKIKGIRAVVCSEPLSARLSKQHNNSNILSMGARIIGIEMAKMIVTEWLAAEFQGGRHQNRIDMISALENDR